MSLFEFVTVMVSMILALSLGQLLGNLSYLARTHREIIPYRPYTLWLVMMGLILVNHWWSLWDLRGINWNYASFLYVLIAPALITFAVGLLAPDRAERGPIDLSAQFLRVRPIFTKVMLAYVLAMWFDGPLLSGQDVFGLVGLVHMPMLAILSLSLFGTGTRLNMIAPIVMTIAVLTVITVRFLA